ncbi:MAG TPA: thioredoxin family protein [Anaerolineae bacterium]|nr:thioredoxin family protein [Anaerolineae bacterium]
MSKKKTSPAGKKPARHSVKKQATTPTLSSWQIAVIVGVIVLIAGVLWLKSRPATLDSASAKAQPTLGVHSESAALATPQPVLATSTTSDSNTLAPRAGELPEAHLDRLLEEGQPVFAFFHSTTCAQCIEMTKIVEQVYPDFAQQVALVDVNVYDDANQNLLQRAGIRVIPTLIFIDRTGQGQGATGVMQAEKLREVLAGLAAGGTP